MTRGTTGIQSMPHNRRQHGLNIVNHDIITSVEKRPGASSCKEALTGPRRETGMALTTDLNQIQDIVDQQFRAVLVGTPLLQLLQGLRAKPRQRTIES